MRSIVTIQNDVIEVRGEICFDKGFQKLNLERQELGIASFANPRNACAGSLKLLDAKEVAKRKLDAVFYNIGEYVGEPIETHEILLKSIQKLDFELHHNIGKQIIHQIYLHFSMNCS